MLMPWVLWLISNTWKAPQSNVCPGLIVFKEHVPGATLIPQWYLLHRERLSRTTTRIRASWKIRYAVWKLKLSCVTCALHPESCYQGFSTYKPPNRLTGGEERGTQHRLECRIRWWWSTSLKATSFPQKSIVLKNKVLPLTETTTPTSSPTDP